MGWCKNKCDKEKVKQGLCFCVDDNLFEEQDMVDIEERIKELDNINNKLNIIENGERKEGEKPKKR